MDLVSTRLFWPYSCRNRDDGWLLVGQWKGCRTVLSATIDMVMDKVTISLNILGTHEKKNIESNFDDNITLKVERKYQSLDQWIQMISTMLSARARYSASTEDWETASCFLLFQQMREDPRKMENHVVEKHSQQWIAQDESQIISNSIKFHV